MIRKLFLGAAVVLAIAFTSCNNSENAQSQTQTATEETNAIEEGAPIIATELTGTFEGTIPGADNGGCKYTVEFGSDGSCTLTRSYQKEGVEPETIICRKWCANLKRMRLYVSYAIRTMKL